MKRDSNSKKKAPQVPAYILELYKAMKPLAHHAPHGFMNSFVTKIATAVCHMTERGPLGVNYETQMAVDAGRIELFSMFLRHEERLPILDLVLGLLAGDETAKATLKIVEAANAGLKWERVPGADEAVKELAAELAERKLKSQS